MIFLDFAPLQHRQCTEKDFERWYARSSEGKECLMGHKVSCARTSGADRSNGTSGESWTRCATSGTSLRTRWVMRRTARAPRKITNGK